MTRKKIAVHPSNTGAADAAAVNKVPPPVQITVRVSKGERRACLLPCELKGVVNGTCSATSLVEQVGDCVSKNFPNGPAMLTLAIGISDLVFIKKEGRYVCEDPVPGDVEVSDRDQFTVEAVGEMRPLKQMTQRNLLADAMTSDTGGRGGSGSGSGSGNNSQSRHGTSKMSASQHGSTQLTSDTDRRGRPGSGSGNSCQSRHGVSETSAPKRGSTQSRPVTRSSEFGAIITKYLESNPATRDKWEDFHNYRGQYVSLIDSLEFFRDHVIPLTTLVHTPPGSSRRSAFIAVMSKRRRNGELSLSGYAIRLAWAYELEKGRIAQFISKLDKEGKSAELKHKNCGGHGVAIRKLIAKAVRGYPDPDATDQEVNGQEYPRSDNDPTNQEGDGLEHPSSDNVPTSQEGDDQEHPSSENDSTSQEWDYEEHLSSDYDSLFSRG